MSALCAAVRSELSAALQGLHAVAKSLGLCVSLSDRVAEHKASRFFFFFFALFWACSCSLSHLMSVPEPSVACFSAVHGDCCEGIIKNMCLVSLFDCCVHCLCLLWQVLLSLSTTADVNAEESHRISNKVKSTEFSLLPNTNSKINNKAAPHGVRRTILTDEPMSTVSLALWCYPGGLCVQLLQPGPCVESHLFVSTSLTQSKQNIMHKDSIGVWIPGVLDHEPIRTAGISLLRAQCWVHTTCGAVHLQLHCDKITLFLLLNHNLEHLIYEFCNTFPRNPCVSLISIFWCQHNQVK